MPTAALRVHPRAVSAVEDRKHGLAGVETARILVVRIVAGLRLVFLTRAGTHTIERAGPITRLLEQRAVDRPLGEQAARTHPGSDLVARRLAATRGLIIATGHAQRHERPQQGARGGLRTSVSGRMGHHAMVQPCSTAPQLAGPRFAPHRAARGSGSAMETWPCHGDMAPHTAPGRRARSLPVDMSSFSRP